MKISLGISALLIAITFMAIACDKTIWDDPDRNGKDKPCIDKSKINKNAACYEIYAPVCGCDGNTYSNDCVAKNAGLKQWTEGECDKSETCIDESKISNNPCPEHIDFVCGCNDITYNNACNAERAGVTEYTKGRCKEQ